MNSEETENQQNEAPTTSEVAAAPAAAAPAEAVPAAPEAAPSEAAPHEQPSAEAKPEGEHASAETHAASEGGEAHAASEGGEAHAASEGGEAHAASEGGEAHAASEGGEAHAASEGGEAHAASEGGEAHAASEGGEAHAASEGDPAGDAPAGEGGATTEGGAAAGESASKKRRRRRRKKHAAEAAGDGTTEAGGEHAEGEEGAAEGEEGAEGAEGEDGKRRRRGPPPPRERPAFSIGEEVFGHVARVTDAAVWIDIAGKATGLLDRRELPDTEAAPVEGDQFIATVASAGVRGGMLMLSRLPILLEESKKVVEAAAQSGETLTGFVTGAVKGGLEVDFGGLRAFAPASHVDLRHGADLSYLVGERLDFVVTQYAKKGRDIVVSRRKFLEEEAHKQRVEAMGKIEVGSVQKGIVRKVVAWGVFVSLPEVNHIEGLIHMTEASHDRGARIGDLFKPGQEIEVKVLRLDEKGKLWLSRKAVTQDPWEQVKEKYPVGSRHKGKVARLQPFGAFIELEPGVDGLIHAADLSLKPIEHPSEVVKVDQEIDVIVVSSDPHARKVGLHPAPAEGETVEPRQRVAPHKAVKVSVTQITEGGLVVRVLGVTGRAARGFIPAGHTGTARGSDLRKAFPIGTELEAKIIEIDPRRGEAKLSIRALKEDTEKQAYQQYRAGVARDSKFGTFADLMKKTSSSS